MGTIYASVFLTLDGVMEAPHVWHPAYVSEESMAVLADHMGSATAMLLGRQTYEEFAGVGIAAWPSSASRWTNSPPRSRMRDELPSQGWGTQAPTTTGTRNTWARRYATSSGRRRGLHPPSTPYRRTGEVAVLDRAPAGLKPASHEQAMLPPRTHLIFYENMPNTPF